MIFNDFHRFWGRILRFQACGARSRPSSAEAAGAEGQRCARQPKPSAFPLPTASEPGPRRRRGDVQRPRGPGAGAAGTAPHGFGTAPEGEQGDTALNQFFVILFFYFSLILDRSPVSFIMFH